MFLLKKVIFWSFTITVLCTNIITSYAYEYPPIKRSSEEWKQLSPEEKHAICQIPDDILATMPTEDLIRAYLNYPYIAIMAAYDNWMAGFNRVYRDFNGLRELLKRDDNAQKLYELYQRNNQAKLSREVVKSL